MPALPSEIVRLLEQCYLTGGHARGVTLAEQVEPATADWPDLADRQTFTLYYGVMLAVLAADTADEPAYAATLSTLHARLAGRDFAPAAVSVLAAELDRLTGNMMTALAHYDQAVQTALRREEPRVAAVAHERMGRWYRDQGFDVLARAHIRTAIDLYARSGADLNTDALASLYPFRQADSQPEQPSDSLNAAMTRLTTFRPLLLDVMTVIRASQTLSAEMYVSRLLEKMQTLVMEHAGATASILLENVEGALRIRARGRDKGTIDTTILPPEPADAPLSLVQYVARTHTAVIINDFSQTDRYATDAYFASQRPCALACLPLVYQGELTGVLYLENGLSAYAFSAEHLELLHILSAQTAISMKNAASYEALEHKVNVRTTELRQAKAAAEAALKRFQALSEATFEGLIIHAHGRILEMNAALEQLSGYSREELLNREIVELLSPEARKEARQRLLSDTPYETCGLRRDGARLPVEIQSRRIDWQGRRVRLTAVRDITWRRALEEENQALRVTLDERDRCGELIGKSPLMRAVYHRLVQAAASDEPVIFSGETGTGKELAARTLFALSKRHTRLFLPVNCGAIQEQLFEPQFFGYRKGSFTGADHTETGYFENAAGGTLFLDEVTELPLTMQVKLLRVLNDGTYTPVGATRAKTADVRIIAATNRDLQDAVRRGVLRADFFHRLYVVPITLPPLRERKEDIPLLAAHFLTQYRSADAAPATLSAAHMDALLAYDWPGNVRELAHQLRRYLVTGQMEFTELPGVLETPAGPRPTLLDEFPFLDESLLFEEAVNAFEAFCISRALARCQNQKTRAAKKLGLQRRTLYTKLNKLGLT